MRKYKYINTNRKVGKYYIQIHLKVTCIDVAVMFQQMHPGGKIKRNEVREKERSSKNFFLLEIY